MFRLQRQHPIICEFNVVLPVSQSLGSQQTPTSGDGGTSLENGNLRALLRGLRETLNLGEAETRGIRAGFQLHSAPATQLSPTLFTEKVTGSCTRGGDGELGGVIEAAGAEQGGS